MTAMRPTIITPHHSGDIDGPLSPKVRERTPVLLAFLCFLIPVLPSYSVPPGPLKSNGSPARMIAIILLILAVLGFGLIKRSAPMRTICPGVVLILAYAVIVLTVYGVSLSHYESEATDAVRTRTIISVAACVGLALYVMRRVVNLRQRSTLLGWLAIGLTFNCVVGLLQNLAHVDIHLLFQPPGFVVNTLAEGLDQTPSLVDRFGAKRAFGTSAHPIEFSVLASVAVLLNLYFARNAGSRNLRVLAAVGVALALLAVPAGVSRSGLIALAAGLLFYMWNFDLRRLGVAMAVGVLAIVVGAGFSGNFQALRDSISGASEDISVTTRLDDYAAVVQVFHSNPVFGLGLGVTPSGSRGVFDNQWWTAFVNGGIVNVAGMIVVTVGGLFGIAAALRRATTKGERDQTYATGAIFIGILSTSVTFDLFGFQQVTLVFFLVFGLLWSNFRVVIPESRTNTARIASSGLLT
jgi:O-antigen ligase